MEDCTVSGGIKIADDGSFDVKIWKNNLHYDNTTPAITVTGSPDAVKYLIGDNPADPDVGWNTPYPCNTFVNGSDASASVISWPEGAEQLYAGKNYWKTGSKDALYHDIQVSGDVRYYERAQTGTVLFPAHWRLIPPEGMAFEKGGAGSGIYYKPNTAEGYIQAGDSCAFSMVEALRVQGFPHGTK